jgi:hypothetical protein
LLLLLFLPWYVWLLLPYNSWKETEAWKGWNDVAVSQSCLCDLSLEVLADSKNIGFFFPLIIAHSPSWGHYRTTENVPELKEFGSIVTPALKALWKQLAEGSWTPSLPPPHTPSRMSYLGCVEFFCLLLIGTVRPKYVIHHPSFEGIWRARQA